MSVPLDILAALKPHFPSSARVLGQHARINANPWQEVVAQTGDVQVTWALDQWALNVPALPIARNDIIGLRHVDRTVRRRRVTIASLMWGYGVSGTRWGSSWITGISNFLGPDLDAVLADCEALLSAGKIAEAHRLFTHPGRQSAEEENHRGIGTPFITKVLYFLARNALSDTSSDYPLILDTKVSYALAQLTGYRLLVRPADYRPRPDSTAYAQYVKAMHSWALELNVLPEVIEYYLWAETSKHDSPLWTEVRQATWP